MFGDDLHPIPATSDQYDTPKQELINALVDLCTVHGDVAVISGLAKVLRFVDDEFHDKGVADAGAAISNMLQAVAITARQLFDRV